MPYVFYMCVFVCMCVWLRVKLGFKEFLLHSLQVNLDQKQNLYISIKKSDQSLQQRTNQKKKTNEFDVIYIKKE